jgi:hypothetical protein
VAVRARDPKLVEAAVDDQGEGIELRLRPDRLAGVESLALWRRDAAGIDGGAECDRGGRDPDGATGAETGTTGDAEEKPETQRRDRDSGIVGKPARKLSH